MIINRAGGKAGGYTPTKNSSAVGGNNANSNPDNSEPFQNSANDYSSRLIENYAREDVYYGTGRRPDGTWDVAAQRDENGLKDNQRSLGGMEAAGESGSNAKGGRQKPSDDFFSGDKWT